MEAPELKDISPAGITREVLDSVQHDGKHYALTRYGKRSCFIVPPVWYANAAAAWLREQKQAEPDAPPDA